MAQLADTTRGCHSTQRYAVACASRRRRWPRAPRFDRKLAYVNHLRALVLDVIDVTTRKIIDRVPIPPAAGASSDEAISPDGKEVWLGMPTNGRTVAMINTKTHRVEAVLNTGSRTNHPNFVTVGKVNYAYQGYASVSKGRPSSAAKTRSGSR
jgi:DNA-binding beta-propeller fold protein YncE